MSGVLDEVDHWYLAMEDGTGRGSDCQTCRAGRSEVDDGSGKTGTVSRDQKKVF